MSDKREVFDDLRQLLSENASSTVDDFFSTLSSIKNDYKFHNKFLVSLKGKSLWLVGVREETDKEYKDRLDKEEFSQKAIEEAELKEYLRLKKKYDKR